MILQHVSRITPRFARLTTSGLLLIQATIATTAISAFISTQADWLLASSAHAQEAQSPIPKPGAVITSAAGLKLTPVAINCSTVTALPIPNCRFSKSPSDLSAGPVLEGIDAGTLRDAERVINQNVRLKILSQERTASR